MSERDEILRRLRARERSQARPPAWRSRQHLPDLAAAFYQALTAAGGEVRRASSLESALNELSMLLDELKALRVAANAEPPLDQVDVSARWPGLTWHVTGRTEGDLRAFCASADAGLTSADAALAETGTIVVSSGPGRSRLVSLLPPVHVALLPTSRLTSDLFTWIAAVGRSELPASITLVSGPSKTADIEQTLAIGVHGPKRVIAILYADQ